jgi:hypothetical protein
MDACTPLPIFGAEEAGACRLGCHAKTELAVDDESAWELWLGWKEGLPETVAAGRQTRRQSLMCLEADG